MNIRKGFTMIELMIVILVIAILAAIAIPTMSKRMEYAKWSEAEGTMAQLANDIRTYMDKWKPTTTAPTLTNLGYPAGVGLGGKYFLPACYTIGAATSYTDPDNMTIVVECTNSGDNATAGGPKTTVGQQKMVYTMTILGGAVTTTWVASGQPG